MIDITASETYRTVAEFARSKLNLSRFKSIYAGFSGGADSLALLLILRTLSAELGFALRAVHFEHGIRGERSRADACWSRAQCANLGVEYLEFPIDVPANQRMHEGLEVAARRLRLKKWRELAGDHHDAAVALGHHLDDRIETLFQRLARGANCSALASPLPVAVVHEVAFLRPLLRIPRLEIEKFLKELGVNEWRIDETNAMDFTSRNALRNHVLPNLNMALPGFTKGAARSLEALETDADFIEQSADAAYAECRRDNFSLRRTSVASMHPSLRARVIRRWLTELCDSDYIPDRRLLDRIAEDLARPLVPEKILVPLPFLKEKFIEIGSEFMCLRNACPSIVEGEKAVRWHWRETPSVFWNEHELQAVLVEHEDVRNLAEPSTVAFDAALFPCELLVDSWHDGDRMTPYGSDTSVRLKKLFLNEKIPAGTRRSTPILKKPDGTIIWMAGVRRSNFAPLIADSVAAVKITISALRTANR